MGVKTDFYTAATGNGQSRKNIVFMRLCGVSGIHFLRRGEQIILLFFITSFWRLLVLSLVYLSSEGDLNHQR